MKATARCLTCAALAAAILTTFAGIARAEVKSWVLARFDDTPEGLAVDGAGNIYTALFHTGKIIKLTPDGRQELVAVVPSEADVGKGDTIGIDLDVDGNIYVAYKEHSPRYEATDLLDPFHTSCREATVTKSGVYRIDAETREVEPLAIRGDGWPFCFPDDVEIDSAGNVYLTDLTFAGIWRISPDGKDVTLWSAHPLLNWPDPPPSGFPLGVNVLVMDAAEENLYAATDGDPVVLRIPILEDGSAGEPVVLSRGHSPFDGIELDDRGNIYVSEILRNEIWVLSPDGSERRLVADKRTAALDNNTSLIWHDGTVCTSNLGFVHEKIEDADRTIVCVSGYDLPGE